jgi:hypothetical protein
VLYAAKCYWPGVTDEDIESAAPLLGGDADATYVGSLLFPGDALVLCLFDANTDRAVRQASHRARIPCERVMSTQWIGDERSACDAHMKERQ